MGLVGLCFFYCCGGCFVECCYYFQCCQDVDEFSMWPEPLDIAYISLAIGIDYGISM